MVAEIVAVGEVAAAVAVLVVEVETPFQAQGTCLEVKTQEEERSDIGLAQELVGGCFLLTSEGRITRTMKT